MKKWFLLAALFQPLTTAYATPLYQIDVLLFTHQHVAANQQEVSLSRSFNPRQQSLVLGEESKVLSPYHLLPLAQSGLQKEYWTLSHKNQYKIIGRFSWLQPAKNTQAIQLPLIDKEGIQVSGTIRVQQGKFYLFETELNFAATDLASGFVFRQQQRLKDKEVYYFDHPQAGMLVAVHAIA